MGEKRRWGDRKDGKLLRDLDGMHFIMPLIYPNRCDNEAYISEKIDLENINKYLAEKNADNPEFKYTIFHIVVAALLKTITLRPKLNRFIVNGNTYQRNELSAAFVVKKIFSDTGDEALAIVKATEDDTIDTIHQKLFEQISFCKDENLVDSSMEAANIFNKIPRFISRAAIKFVCFLDRHGKVPKSLIETDPYYCTAVLSNLGSIKLHSGYHHLTNWGTCSLFVIVGEKKLRPFYKDDGSYEMRESLELGITIDERLADGYYYSKTIKLLQKLLSEPRLLEQHFGEKVEY